MTAPVQPTKLGCDLAVGDDLVFLGTLRRITSFDVYDGPLCAERGGTITLPDGSEIVVEAKSVVEMEGELDRAGKDPGGEPTPRMILAAWNAEYGIAAREPLSEDNEPIREVPADQRKAWEPKPSGYTAEQASADRAARTAAQEATS